MTTDKQSKAREIRRRKREEHLKRLREKGERIGMLRDLIVEMESRPYEEQDHGYLGGLRVRLRRVECELANMNQV